MGATDALSQNDAAASASRIWYRTSRYMVMLLQP